MKKNVWTALFALGLVILGATSAEAGLRRFYWTAEAQAYAYDIREAQLECYERAEAQAYPYAFRTCSHLIGAHRCELGTTRTEYLNFAGQPGLYNCRVRVWVEAWE